MNENVAHILKQLMVQYGSGLCSNPLRLKGLLRDYCGQNRREINILLCAVAHRVVEDLLRAPSQHKGAFLTQRLAKRLYEEAGMAQECANWAVATWAEAVVHGGEPIYIEGSCLGQHFSKDIDQELLVFNPQVKQEFRGSKGWKEFFSHKPNGAQNMTFSPDNRLIASVYADNTMEIRELETGNLLTTMKGPKAVAHQVEFSPDGQLLASAGIDGFFRIWRVEDGTLIRQVQAHPQGVSAIAYSADGKLLASGGMDNTIKLWWINSGFPIRILRAHTGPVTSLAFAPNGGMLASGGGDGAIRFWRLSDRRLTKVVHTQDGTVQVLMFSSDSSLLLFKSSENVVGCLQISQGSYYRLPTMDLQQAQQIAFSAHNQLVAVATPDGLIDVRKYGGLTNETKTTWRCPWPDLTSLAFSPDGEFLSAGSHDKRTVVWHLFAQGTVNQGGSVSESNAAI